MPNINIDRYVPEGKFPQIYVYSDKNQRDKDGCLKVGYTERKNINDRIKEQYDTAASTAFTFNVEYSCSSVREDGTYFTDHDVHEALRQLKAEQLTKASGTQSEWFKTDLDTVKKAINSVIKRIPVKIARKNTFPMREEQREAVEKTFNYFTKSKLNNKFLWNAKMRFGKTFTSYQLMLKMKWSKVLVLTFKPAVEDAWKTDLLEHQDFEGYDFITVDKKTGKYNKITTDKYVCFASFQNLLGKDTEEQIKEKNRWIHDIDWDCIILDEYHYGAWREKATDLTRKDGEETDEIDVHLKPEEFGIRTKYYLYLSGTPFRAINSGEFIEEQVYSWTYSDEQSAKEKWYREKPGIKNPYESLPEMVMFTYMLPDNLTAGITDDYNEFDLNQFFKAEGSKFKNQNLVQNWLNLLRNQYSIKNISDPKAGEIPPLPYSDAALQAAIHHSVWYLPSVASCSAMEKLLKNDPYFSTYKIINCSGKNCGDGLAAKEYLDKEMKGHNATITLTCGKLTTGVTVKPWSAIFMLSNLRSPETYFQAAFRVQSPNVVRNQFGEEVVLKEKCYVFDFAPNRALRQVETYAGQLNTNANIAPDIKVGEFIKYLPILAYDGQAMKKLDPREIMDIALSGTTATLLAKRWQSAVLVNLDTQTLKDLLNNKEALKAVMNIEGFRAIGSSSIETLVNKTEKLKSLRTKEKNKTITDEEKKEEKEIADELKKDTGVRKQIQEKLIKFATRIPIFMYLTDFREATLQDVIRKLDSKLFEKVTGLTISDFNTLVNIGLFNKELMNNAVYNFRCYEDRSLEYTGIRKHNENILGLMDTTTDNDIKNNLEIAENSKDQIKKELEKNLYI